MRARLTAVAAMTLALAGCVTIDGGSDTADAEERTLTVYAAVSLTQTFEEVGEQFEAENDGVSVQLGFGGSSDLVAQLQAGAPADVLATADETTMTSAVDDGLVDGDPEPIATNVLQVVTPAGNPADVQGLSDLARPDVQVVLCAPVVPCGAAAQRLEGAAGIDVRPVSEEQSVTDVLGKVASGEADAGLVYVTDVLGAGDAVLGIDVPEADTAVNSYPIAALAGSNHPDLAAAFVAFVLGEQGRRVLAEAGFGPP